MSDLYNEQGDLYNIYSTLDMLVDETKNTRYKEILKEIKFEVKEELDEVEEAIYKQEEKEQQELEREYDSMRL